MPPRRREELETDIEQDCCDIALEVGWTHYKMDKKAGWPDQLFIGPHNRHFFVEFKRPGEKARRKQLARHAKLRALGHTVAVIDDRNHFRAILDCVIEGVNSD